MHTELGCHRNLLNYQRAPAQAWREDRTLIAAAQCIADALGQRYVESIPLSMEAAWAEASPRVPLICLLSPGAHGHAVPCSTIVPFLLAVPQLFFPACTRSAWLVKPCFGMVGQLPSAHEDCSDF